MARRNEQDMTICLSQTVSINLVQTCTYIMIVYKSQGID